jgi:hypothetical protein
LLSVLPLASVGFLGRLVAGLALHVVHIIAQCKPCMGQLPLLLLQLRSLSIQNL